MPPKRKAPVAKASEVVENGSASTEPSKPKRGRTTKQTEKIEVEEIKTTRSRRGKAAPVVAEKNKTEAENTKVKTAKAKTEKAQVKKAVVDEEGSSKKTPTKKKDTKPLKETKSTKQKATSAKPKTNAKASPKVNRARRAKKDDDETENDPESSNAKPKATKKAAATVKSQSAPSKDEPKAKKPRAKAAETKSDPVKNQTETDFTTIDFSFNKDNPTGKLPNFKIICWNVDGIRAWMKKNGLEYITREQPNIFCLQETKCGREKIPDELNKFMNYKAYWCTSNKEGYAGVALFTIDIPLNVSYGIENDEFDVEGRCITAEYDTFYVVNVYVPNAGRGLVTLPKRLEWNTIFKEYIAKLDEKKPVIVCGDMNVAHNEIDIANPKGNKKNAGFTPEEREGMTEFLSDKYVDTYRTLYPEQIKAYTFWSYMQQARSKDIGWRLDYFIVSKRLMDNVCDNVIRSKVFGSDHCPIVLYLNV